MKREKSKFLLLLIAIVTPTDEGPPDNNNAIADGDTLDARMRELLRPIFPQQYPLH